jgi:hypothetical protein
MNLYARSQVSAKVPQPLVVVHHLSTTGQGTKIRTVVVNECVRHID